MISINKQFYPTSYAKSVYQVDFEKLYSDGVRGILLDIDNTLVPHGMPADERSIQLIRHLKKIGFQTCLISNNRKARVESFAEKVGSDYIFGAFKPRRKNYRIAMDVMGTTLDNTLLLGDQLFTDIWGANRTGIRSILVEPIHKSEEIQIVWKRKLEKIILRKDHKD